MTTKKGSAQVAESNLCHYVDSLRLALSTSRNEALEEAAKVLDDKAGAFRLQDGPTMIAMALIFEEQAAAIRKLKG